MPLIYDGIEDPVEIAPGRGDLRYSSVASELGRDNRHVRLVDGKPVSFARIFATQPMVGAAVMRMLWWSVKVPLKLYRRTGDDSRERVRPEDHPLAEALVRPWERGSQAALTMSQLGPLLVHGNGITGVQSGARDRIQFEPFDYRCALPIRQVKKFIRGWDISEDADEQPRTIPADQMIHSAWWSPYGALGISPLHQLGTTISIEDAAQRYQRAMFKNGARPPSAIEADKEFLGLKPAERETLLQNLREDITAIYSGPDNGGKPAILPPGLEWKPVAHTAVEAGLIDQRKVNREEICAIYQIPPPFLAILDRATYSNITTLQQVAYTDGLGPPLVLIEQSITSQLVWGLLREFDLYVEYDFSGVLRGDRLKEIQSLREAIGTALLTPNEGRAAINRPRSTAPGADDLWIPKNNLRRLGEPDEDPQAPDDAPDDTEA